MKQAGLKLKKIGVKNAPKLTAKTKSKHEKHTVKLQKKIKSILAKDGHLVFADECIFTARGFQNAAWSNINENVRVADSTGNQPCQALCGAVCSCHGLLAHMITDYSFNQEKFIEFLRRLHDAVNGEKVYLFLDNCRVHHGKDVKPVWAELNITPVWNVPYRYQFNDACEKYWSQIKSTFRPLLL